MATKVTWPRALAIAAVFALLGAACSSGGDTGSTGSTGTTGASGGGTIIHGTTDTIVSLDPAGQYDFGSFQPSAQIYNTLLEVPAGGSTPEPALAESCDTDDSMTYTCTLRSGVTFSDGSDLTSEDVLYSFKRNIEINDPAGACSLLASLAACGKWKDCGHGGARSPNRGLPSGCSRRHWPFILTTSAAFIVPTSYPETSLQPDDQAIGTGRYTLAQFRSGEQVVLEANADFWGDPRPTTGSSSNTSTSPLHSNSRSSRVMSTSPGAR